MSKSYYELKHRKTRVIFVANYAAFYSGNFIASLTELEKQLIRRGITVLYVFPKNAPFCNWEEGGKFDEHHAIHTVDFEPHALTVELKNIVRSETEDSYTIVHMHFLAWKDIGIITRKLKNENCMFVAQEHMRVDFGRGHSGLTLMRKCKAYIKQVLYKYATAKCRMIGVSDAVYEDLCQIRGKKSQTYMVRNAISTSRLDGSRCNSLNLNPLRDVVIFGTHFERKGVDIALNAVIESELPVRLVVLTHHEQDAEKRLDALYPSWHKYAVVEHVVEDIATVYDYALCFISPSRSEAFGYAVVEAAYCDTQVIASDIPGQNSIRCVPGIQWVKADSVDSLVDALTYCYEIKSNQSEIIKVQKEKQRAYIREHFGLNVWCDEIMKIYGLYEV